MHCALQWAGAEQSACECIAQMSPRRLKGIFFLSASRDTALQDVGRSNVHAVTNFFGLSLDRGADSP